MAEKLAPLGKKKMNWHMILIYFVLWIMAFMNLVNGLLDVNGIKLQTTADGALGVLRVYDGSNAAFAFYARNARFFILNGVFMLIMCMFIVYVRFQLAGMKRRGPMLLMVMFGLDIVESAVYTAFLYFRVNAWAQTISNAEEAAQNLAQLSVLVSNGLVQIGMTAVVAGLTWVYYQRRRDMFTN